MVVNPDKFWSIIISRLRKLKESYKLLIENHKRDKIFMSGLSKFCRRQSLKNLLSPLLNTLSLLRISIRSLKDSFPLKFFKVCLPQNLLGPLFILCPKIDSENSVTLLCIKIDNKLNFGKQVTALFQKADRQLKQHGRLSGDPFAEIRN